uniref:Uncharacterized protein n=1 Tax=Sphaerodactylus townsendi TaxID=933632 RepID=A0ACB8FL88_9SAUR
MGQTGRSARLHPAPWLFPPLSSSAHGKGLGRLDKNRKLRPLYDIPYMFEAREFLRKKLIGKKGLLLSPGHGPPGPSFPLPSDVTLCRLWRLPIESGAFRPLNRCSPVEP